MKIFEKETGVKAYCPLCKSHNVYSNTSYYSKENKYICFEFKCKECGSEFDLNDKLNYIIRKKGPYWENEPILWIGDL